MCRKEARSKAKQSVLLEWFISFLVNVSASIHTVHVYKISAYTLFIKHDEHITSHELTFHQLVYF